MSDKFNQFINRVLSHEGGYANHPKDPGGETNWGITKRTAQANGYNGSMRAMTREQAISIYRKAFWERYRADQMPEAVAFQFLMPASTTVTAMPPVCCNAPQAYRTTALSEQSASKPSIPFPKTTFYCGSTPSVWSFIPSSVRSPLSARAGYAVWRKT